MILVAQGRPSWVVWQVGLATPGLSQLELSFIHVGLHQLEMAHGEACLSRHKAMAWDCAYQLLSACKTWWRLQRRCCPTHHSACRRPQLSPVSAQSNLFRKAGLIALHASIQWCSKHVSESSLQHNRGACHALIGIDTQASI